MPSNSDLLRRVSLRQLIPDHSHDGLLAYGHAAVFAMTRSGKTELMRYLSRKSARVTITWNPAGQKMPGHVRARNAAEVRKHLAEGRRHIDIHPPAGMDAQIHLLEQISELVMAIGRKRRQRQGGDKATHWCTLLLDEVQMVAPIGQTSGPVHTLYQLAAKEGITIWSLSQDPAQMASVVIQQSLIYVCMRVKAVRVDYLEKQGVPIRAVWDHINKPHRFALIIGNDYALSGKIPV